MLLLKLYRWLVLLTCLIFLSPQVQAMLAGYNAPLLTGNYESIRAKHPFVFTNQERMVALLRLHTTASNQALKHLEQVVQNLVRNPEQAIIRPYSGSDLNQYSKVFSCAWGGSCTVAACNLATYAYLRLRQEKL